MAEQMDFRLRKGLPTAIILFCCPAALSAAPPEISLSYDALYSDNIENVAVEEASDLENRFSLGINYQTDPGKCVASVDGGISHSIYSENTFDPETQVNGGLTGNCELARGLSWEVDNQIREVTRTSREADTPENRTRKNIFQTGPSYRWRLNPRDSVLFSARYENTELSDPEDVDSNTVNGSVFWNHLFAPDFSAGLSASVRDSELDTTEERRTRTLNIRFNKRWATTTVSGSVGVSEVETELGSTRREFDGFDGELNLTRDLDSSATVFLRASRELTDQTSDFDIRFDEFTFELTDISTQEVTTIETGLNKSFSNGDRLTLTAFANRSDFLESVEREDQSGLRAGYNRQISPLLSATGNARYEYLTFESDQSDDQILGLDLGLNYRASRTIDLAAGIGRTERTSDIRSQEYEENWVFLSIDYRFR